ncbi:MAG TPA: LamG domain-containing protein [Bacteroidetes bacterium]|nr:LamG domain-containing protein [Bacteroidota bacterium]
MAMKYYSSFLSLFFIASIFSSLKYIDPEPQSLADGLVAHYTFNKCVVNDETKNCPDGNIFGKPGCHCGVEGNALFLDGLDDYIEFPGIVNRCFNTTDFTISFYIKPGKYSVFKQSLFSKRENFEQYNMLDFQLDINMRKIKTDLYETPEKYFKNISPEMPGTDWMHFALVRRGIHAYTYINGELRREGRRCSGVDIGNEALLSFSNSACLSTGRAVRYKGGLDELRIYDRALSEKEIAKLYALHPVENAETDCITFIPKNNLKEIESAYICAVSD